VPGAVDGELLWSEMRERHRTSIYWCL
jgi:hypothetical protein